MAVTGAAVFVALVSALALTADGSKLLSDGRTGTINHSPGHAGHPHEPIVEFRGDPGLDLSSNRTVGDVGRGLNEYLLHLCRAAAQ